MAEGFLLKIFLEDNDQNKCVTHRWIFSSKDKCNTFIFQLFGHRLFEWARKHSDEWEEIQQDLGFRGRTDDKCLEILAMDPLAMSTLWQHYERQGKDEGNDVWVWEMSKLEQDPVKAPIEIGAYHLDKDFYQ